MVSVWDVKTAAVQHQLEGGVNIKAPDATVRGDVRLLKRGQYSHGRLRVNIGDLVTLLLRALPSLPERTFELVVFGQGFTGC